MHLFVPAGGREEQVVVAIPRAAAAWTQAIRNRGLHRVLVPAGPSGDCEIAIRYVGARLAERLASIHLVNVQPSLATAGSMPVVSDRTPLQVRIAEGEDVLDRVRCNVGPLPLRMTAEVAFGSTAETVCAIAQPQRFSGIVIGRRSFALHDLMGRSVIAKILQLARVPVTIVSRHAAVRDERNAYAGRGDQLAGAKVVDSEVQDESFA